MIRTGTRPPDGAARRANPPLVAGGVRAPSAVAFSLTPIIMPPHTRRDHAFTLIELLVVIAIIALLTGILIPSLSQARHTAKALQESAMARQLMLGYASYAHDHRDFLIPGHINDTPPLNDDGGRPLSPAEVVRRWPWRMVGYLGVSIHGSILIHERSATLEDRTQPMWSYMVSLTPSLGLNMYALGGDLSADGANNMPGCLRRSTDAFQPAHLIVFASARSAGQSEPIRGYHKIVPPTKPFEYSARGWTTQAFDPHAADPSAWGYVDARWIGGAVTAYLDGHAVTHPIDDLRDMTRWSDVAALRADPDWRP